MASQQAQQSVSRATWTSDRDARLLAELVLCKNDALDADGSSFKPAAWTRVEQRFNAEFDATFTKQQLKSRYAVLRDNYKLWKDVNDNSSFGFDEENGVPTAPDQVWKDYLAALAKKDVAKVEQFRLAPLPHLDDSTRLFEGNLATGSFARSRARSSSDTGSRAVSVNRSDNNSRATSVNQSVAGPSRAPASHYVSNATRARDSDEDEDASDVDVDFPALPPRFQQGITPLRLAPGPSTPAANGTNPANTEAPPPFVPRSRKRARTNGAASLADALDRATEAFNAPSQKSVVQQATQIFMEMKEKGLLEPSQVMTLVNKVIKDKSLAEAILVFDEDCRKFWVDSELRSD